MVSLTPSARDWLQHHGGSLTLRAAPQHGCCGGHAALPMAEPRIPDAKDEYEVETIEGITIYRARTLAEGPYVVYLEGFWGWRRLGVEGAISPWRPSKTQSQPAENTDVQTHSRRR